jgi:hypothetical protein
LTLVPIGIQRGAHAGRWVWLAAIPFHLVAPRAGRERWYRAYRVRVGRVECDYGA